MNLIFKGFLQTWIPPLISIFYHDFPSKICCLTVSKCFVEEAFSVWESFRYQITLDKRWEGQSITIFRRKFVSQYRNFSQGNPLVRELISGIEKFLCIKGVYHDFLLKFFCLTKPKKFAGEPFGVSKNFGYRKNLCTRGVYHDFLLKFFCRTVPKKNRRGTIMCFRKLLVSENLMLKRGHYHDFPS